MKTVNYFCIMLLFVLSTTHQAKIKKNKQAVSQLCLTTAGCSGCGSNSNLKAFFYVGNFGYECNFVIPRPNTQLCCTPSVKTATSKTFNYISQINFELQGNDGIGIKSIDYSPYSISRFVLVSTGKTDLIKSGIGLWFDNGNSGNCPYAAVALFNGNTTCFSVPK